MDKVGRGASCMVCHLSELYIEDQKICIQSLSLTIVLSMSFITINYKPNLFSWFLEHILLSCLIQLNCLLNNSLITSSLVSPSTFILPIQCLYCDVHYICYLCYEGSR